MNRYVVGFAFNKVGDQVVLIKKNRPAWQSGLLNGIGGHIEETDKTALDAMIREFEEETSVLTSPKDWNTLCSLSNTISQKWVVFFFIPLLI